MRIEFDVHRALTSGSFRTLGRLLIIHISGGGGSRTAAVAALVGLGLLIVLAFAVLNPPQARAQATPTSVTLVSNQANAAHSFEARNSHDRVQAFTTGGHAAGYTLTSVSLMFTVTNSNGNNLLGYEVEIWETNLQSRPTAKLATLQKPSILVTGSNTFTASGSGVWLAASTTYAVVWNITRRDSGIKGRDIFLTPTINLSQTGEAGWEIANKFSSRVWNSNLLADWSDTQHGSFRISGSGYQGRAPSPASTAPPDPSNLARSEVQWEPVGGIHPVPARIGEISSNKPSGASGSLDLTAIAASVSEDLRRHSRGFYVTVLIESAVQQRHLLRNLEYELARGAPLIRVHIWHVYRHVGRGTNTVELLGEAFIGRAADQLAEPVQICLPAPDAEHARIAVRGRLDRDWTILETRLTDDGRLCAETVRVSWFTIVLAPEPESAAA